MSSSTVVQSNTSIQVAAPATSKPVSSTEKKKDGRNKIFQSSLSPENKNVEVSELVELDQTQEKCSSETKVIPRHLKTLLRYETCDEGCFPLFRAIISAVGPKNWDPDWSEWEQVENFVRVDQSLTNDEDINDNDDNDADEGECVCTRARIIFTAASV